MINGLSVILITVIIAFILGVILIAWGTVCQTPSPNHHAVPPHARKSPWCG